MEISLKKREDGANSRRETEAGDKRKAEYTTDKREVGANNERETEVGNRKEPSKEAGTCSKETETAAKDSRGDEYAASKEADLIDMWEEKETER